MTLIKEAQEKTIVIGEIFDQLRVEAARLKAENEELVGMLVFARTELASFPRSLGYDITALPKIDELLEKIRK